MSETKGRRATPQAAPPSAPTPPPASAAEPMVTAPVAPGPTAAVPAVTPPSVAAPVVTAPTAIPAIARRRSEAASREMLAFGRTTLDAAAETQAAMARGFEALALEISGIARSGIAVAGDSAKAMLGAKTLTDAVEVQIGFTRRSIDMLIGGSVKLTEIGMRLANEASRPLLSRIADPAKALR